jgi:D-glycero-alpha-D-manno-heptose 1-phosphate guanylyltransferase
MEKGSLSGKGLINGGIYSLRKEWFLDNSPSDKFSIEKDLFEHNANKHTLFGMVCKQYFIDIGIPEDYEKAQNDFITFER